MTTEQLSMSMFANRSDYDAAVRAQAEQLPEGLDRAVMLIDGVRGYVIFKSGEDRCSQAIDAIRVEHAQRLALRHHACDLAQRAADLEKECDELRMKHDELLTALHLIGKALGIPEGERSPYSVTCGTLERVNRLAEIEAQEPACWAVIDPTGGGSVEYTAAWREACHEHIGNMITEADMPEAAGFLVRQLFTRPVPAQAVPDGWRLVQVKSEEFDSLMYWLGRCDDKGHLENCPDLIEPWENFDYRDVAAAPEHKE